MSCKRVSHCGAYVRESCDRLPRGSVGEAIRAERVATTHEKLPETTAGMEDTKNNLSAVGQLLMICRHPQKDENQQLNSELAAAMVNKRKEELEVDSDGRRKRLRVFAGSCWEGVSYLPLVPIARQAHWGYPIVGSTVTEAQLQVVDDQGLDSQAMINAGWWFVPRLPRSASETYRWTAPDNAQTWWPHESDRPIDASCASRCPSLQSLPQLHQSVRDLPEGRSPYLQSSQMNLMPTGHQDIDKIGQKTNKMTQTVRRLRDKRRRRFF